MLLLFDYCAFCRRASPAPDLVDAYIQSPPWISSLPPISHCRGKSKLPFAFEKSTPHTDAVLNYVLTCVLKRANTLGYTRASRILVKHRAANPAKAGGARIAGPWLQLVTHVMKEDCQVTIYRH